ncbi:MAG: hypothetical protein JO345_32320 [Streptosporangiaceae bacterium]|nr:hypothetical protein [Streptosporangiaceae bacterium]
MDIPADDVMRGEWMLYVFGFERVGVVVGDLYFVDPAPKKGQEGAEHGVRLELRVLGRGPLRGSIYSAQPIEVGEPVWRADFLESVDGEPGSFDRTHHHPVFRGWDPTSRVFVRELSADPLGWLAGKLADLDGLLAEAGFPQDTAGPGDARDLRDAAPEIIDATRRLLDKVRAGELGNPPLAEVPAADRTAAGADGEPALIRSGWL